MKVSLKSRDRVPAYRQAGVSCVLYFVGAALCGRLDKEPTEGLHYFKNM